MAFSNLIQWLLGLAIAVIGAFILFDRAEDAPSLASQQNAALPIAPEEIPPPPAGLPIKLVDAKTKACMADIACMQDFFLRVTLGNEYEPRTSDDPRINRWQNPISYRVYGWDRLDQAGSEAMKQGLADMTEITGLVGLQLGPSTRGINVIVLLAEDLKVDLASQFSELADKAFRPAPGFLEGMLHLPSRSTSCAANVAPKTDGAIVYVGIFVNARNTPASLRWCLYEEFSQMLGRYADVADDIDSLYTDQAHRRQLTEFNFLLLRLLYHPLIKPGMSREAVVSVFPDAYREIITKPVALPAGI